jgi:hypothetical protein
MSLGRLLDSQVHVYAFIVRVPGEYIRALLC